MITLRRLCAALDSTGIPWSNQRAHEGDGQRLEPPYISLVAGYGDSAYADNRSWATWMGYDVALYTRERDYALERKVAAALEAAECPFTLAITEIESEGLIEAAFSVNVDEEESTS